MPQSADSLIHLAFRFHVNLYHSYRGDSLDERGIGKDIRIIRCLLDTLDSLNAAGIPIRGTWDMENYYSLEVYLPRHAPDIIERIRGRVMKGLDEVELMSWNNGLLTAHSGEEFEDSIARAISNTGGSGLADLFGEWAPIVRPQECMFSTSQIARYRKLGVEALSLYYSAAPFNGFGSFVPPLGLVERYNPLTLHDGTGGAEMRLLPAYSPADIVEHWGSLKRWLRGMRRDQCGQEKPRDLLLLIDMDADDSFWEGFVPRLLSPLLPSFTGFESLVRNVAGLPWLRFCRPWDYLKSHEDVARISFGQDLADGSFDGYSSWSEKAENLQLWTRIAEARRLAALARRVAGERGAEDSAPYREAAAEARTALLLALSTTHFGMASPAMNTDRLRDAFARAQEAVRAAGEALALAVGAAGTAAPDVAADVAAGGVGNGDGAFYFDERIDALPRGEGALVSVGSEAGGDGSLEAVNPEASRTPSIPRVEGGATLLIAADSIGSGGLALRCAPRGGVALFLDGKALFEEELSRPWVRHGRRVLGPVDGRTYPAPIVKALVPERMAELSVSGSFAIEKDARVEWRHRYTLAAGLSSVRVDIEVNYPRTRHVGFDRAKALRLRRDWDARWLEVAPFELVPALEAGEGRPIRVWKHGFDDAVGSYALDYQRFGPNRELASFDNHVTDGWVAVSDGERGLLLAQADSAQTLFAFCPMRLGIKSGRQVVRLNPFGSYYGSQWRYPTAVSGLGRLAALAVGDNYDPYAPSWEGERLGCSLLIAPYSGDRPPAALQRDALIFATGPRRPICTQS